MKTMALTQDLKAMRSQKSQPTVTSSYEEGERRRKRDEKFHHGSCLRQLNLLPLRKLKQINTFVNTPRLEAARPRSTIPPLEEKQIVSKCTRWNFRGSSSSAFNYPRRIGSRCCAAADAERSHSRGGEREEGERQRCALARASNGFWSIKFNLV